MAERMNRFTLRSGDQLLYLRGSITDDRGFFNLLASQFKMEEVVRELQILVSSDPQERLWPHLRELKLIATDGDYSVYRYFRRKPVFLTLLQDPVQRLLSSYHHFAEAHDDRTERSVDNNKVLLQFQEFTDQGSLILNHDVKRLAGAIAGEAGFLSDHAMLEVAKVRLDEFAFFGILEYFEDTIRLFSYTFGWHALVSEKMRTLATAGAYRLDPSPSVITWIKDKNRLDIDLYEFALQEFNLRIKSMLREQAEAIQESSMERALTEQEINDFEEPALVPFHGVRFIFGRRVPDWIGAIRRVVIPPGSRAERVYLRLRARLLGW